MIGRWLHYVQLESYTNLHSQFKIQLRSTNRNVLRIFSVYNY